MTNPNRRPSLRKKESKAVKRALKLTTLILAHDFVSHAQAQSTNATPPTADGTNAPSQKLPDVVVTGEKGSYKTDEVALPKVTEPLRDVPQSITVVPREVMNDQNTTTLRDVLRNVAGISIAAGEGGSQGDNLTLRGFTVRNDIFLDGMRDYGSYYRDPFNYETVDVLEGPDSIMFGRGSTGGVVNQESKTPGLNPFIETTLSLGTDATRRATADINEPLPELGKNTAFRLNLMGNDSQVAGRDVGENRRYGLAPSLAFGIGTPTTLTLSYLHQSEDDIPDYGIPWLKFNGNPAPVDRSNFYGFKSDYLRTDVDMVTAKLEHTFNEFIQIQNQARFANYCRDFRITEPQVANTNAAPPDTLSVVRNQLAGQSTETYLWDQMDATVEFKTAFIDHTLVTGVEGGRETSDPKRLAYSGVPGTSLLSPNEGQNFSGTASIRSKVKTSATSFGAYAIDTMKLGEHWQLSGGARWDYFDADFRDAVPNTHFTQNVTKPTWRGALVYKPVENGSIYFDYGTSFNPSAESLSLSAGSANVKPEENQTFEFGTKWDLLNNRLSVRGSVFRTEKTNARETNPTNSLEVVDGGLQRVDGVELAVSGHLTKEWQIFASYDYLDSEVVQSKFFPDAVGKPLNNVPKNTFNLWTTYELPWRVEVGGGLNFVSSRTANTATLKPNTPVEKVDAYWTLNAMIKYRASKRITVQANIYNLTDNYYLDQVHPAHVIPGAGISALFSTTLTF
ncbi:MAG TPA: TonB-dependent siderophore receptor [Verrucomicrobiae bacterium]|jgi:catecholate siderophore receptor|nr:TonB-dependent siderophore receptor [Verrucomicrobiae bacterium]